LTNAKQSRVYQLKFAVGRLELEVLDDLVRARVNLIPMKRYREFETDVVKVDRGSVVIYPKPLLKHCLVA